MTVHSATTPKVVAHRGASAYRAEHTLAAYQLALSQGADAVECDVRLTKDGHLVCVHDRTVQRTSNGSGVVSARTLAELNRLDFDSWHPAAESISKSPGILTFEALLGVVRDHARDITLFVETKHPVRYAGRVETKLIELLDRHGLATPRERATSPIAVMSFSVSAVKRLRAAAPALPTVLLWEHSLFAALRSWQHDVLPPWADIAGPSIDVVRADPDFVTHCHERGNAVYCWTANDPADIQLGQRLGVDYLVTDDPATAINTLGAV